MTTSSKAQAETHTEFGPRKTVVILAIVAGCFAILWPKIFYPMLTASLYPPPPVDTSGKYYFNIFFNSKIVIFFFLIPSLCIKKYIRLLRRYIRE